MDRVILPGLCAGDLAIRRGKGSRPRGARPRRPARFAGILWIRARSADYGAHDIKILAEINHAPRLSLAEIIAQARRYRESGADVIDLGCDPGVTWTGVGETVRQLRAEGMRVSIDSFNAEEVEAGGPGGRGAGAERQPHQPRGGRVPGVARSSPCPMCPGTLEGLDRTVETLHGWGVPFRIDPVIEPIGFGFAASLGRYLEVRRRYPDAEMFMGVGNLTELIDVDSAGVNVLLLGFCQEVGIRSVLTTEVINWCRSSVKELDLARRLVYYACREHVLPKHLEPDLVMLRDPKLREHGEQTLRELAAAITDRNFRLFAERGLIHVINRAMYLQGADPFVLFDEMHEQEAIDPSHAFYLGYEMAKAVTALTLGKNYVQDQALRWGFLTLTKESGGREPPV